MKVTLQLITDGEDPGSVHKEFVWEDAVPDMTSVDLIEYEGRPFVYFDNADAGGDELWIYCMADKSMKLDARGGVHIEKTPL